MKESSFVELNISSEIQPVALNHPTGLCLDKQREHLFIADSNNHRVMMLNLELGTFKQFEVEAEVVDSKTVEKRLFKRHTTPDITHDITEVGPGSDISLTFNHIIMELNKEAPSRWQLSLVCDGEYLKCLKSGSLNDDQAIVSYSSSVSHLLQDSHKMEVANVEICLESMLYLCKDGICSIKKVLVSIPLSISKRFDSDQTLSIDVPC